jgi:hypothetical protein
MAAPSSLPKLVDALLDALALPAAGRTAATVPGPTTTELAGR